MIFDGKQRAVSQEQNNDIQYNQQDTRQYVVENARITIGHFKRCNGNGCQRK